MYNCCIDCTEIIATIIGGYDTDTVLIKDLSIFVKVIDINGVMRLTISSDGTDIKRFVVTKQQKQAYCQLLQYLFQLASFDIVTQENGILAIDSAWQ